VKQPNIFTHKFTKNYKRLSWRTSILAGLMILGAQSNAGSKPLVADEGWTSNVHKKNPKTIAFSNSHIDRGNPDASDFITTTDIEDDLYMRVYLDGSFENNFRKNGEQCDGDKRRMLSVSIGDEDVFLESKSMHKADWDDWTAYLPLGDGPFNRKPSFALIKKSGFANEDQTPFAFWTNLAPRLKPGKNVLRFESIADCNMGLNRVVVATGELTVNADAKTLKKLIAKNRPPLPRTKMASEHEGIKEAIERKWPSLTVYDVSVTSNTWSIKRHPIHGHPVERSIGAWVVSNGEKQGCTIMTATLSQAANGDSYHSNFTDSIYTGKHTAFSCP